jgi:hypothetical protein
LDASRANASGISQIYQDIFQILYIQATSGVRESLEESDRNGKHWLDVRGTQASYSHADCTETVHNTLGTPLL